MTSPQIVALLLAVGVAAAVVLRLRTPAPNVEPSPPPSFLPLPSAPVPDVSTWTPHRRAAPFLHLVEAAESKHRIPRNLLARLLEQESDWDPRAFFGPTGASGIAQIVPRWHPNVADPFDPTEAIDYAGFYLRQLFDAHGTWSRALAAYNWGWGNVSKWIQAGEQFASLPHETQNYISDITGDVPV